MSALPHLPNLGLVSDPHQTALSTWEEPTPLLRFMRRATGKTILQQKFVIHTIRGHVPVSENSTWRDVPMVEEDAD